MSDFGFDTVAFSGREAPAPSHLLVMARELIADGQPREALDLLSQRQDELSDEPEYLIVCSEAWWADGDTLRAQQALLGAARLVPKDPAPLLLLAELLRQAGDLDKAERVLTRANALGGAESPSAAEDLVGGEPAADDLIAVAELRERRARVVVTPKRILVAGAVLILVSCVVLGIGKLTDPEAGSATVEQDGADAATTEAKPAGEPSLAPPVEVGQADSVSVSTAAPVVEPASESSPPVAVAHDVPDTAVQSAKRPAVEAAPPVDPIVVKSKRKRAAKKPAPEPEPEPQALLALTASDPKALTEQGDTLHADGQTGLAATYYRRALEVDPDYAPALVGVGRSILRAEKYDEAFVNATRALQLARGVDSRPGLEAESIYQLGRVHLDGGNLDAARRLFRQSTTLPAAPAEAWFYLGEALASDNSPAARSAYEAYLARVPNGPLAERARRAIQ